MSEQNTDKRSVSTDALDTLGMVHFREEKRDAIHLAVEPVEASEELVAGETIIIKDGIAYPAPRATAQGIVDPFLATRVSKGQRFWFVMMPRQVQSLRHVWSHKDFPDEE